MNLSKAEEQLMEIIWRLEKAFLKDLIDAFPAPAPAATTVATLLKRMSDKGFVGHKLYGNSREYYPLVTKSDYFARHVKGMIKNNFNNSALQFASFFTKATNLTASELEELRKIVDEEIKNKKK
ncbi:BlaI/MecI/CopY family transcriptional regulator [Flavitalea sp. BT771]|uniref:BlaI/MecI/CopY family transcriptional regulator n=1 Tax=Flavitalea sp. BT771 TaxID=3063329 RepID=UPI0026E38A0D|nr:BlaI/MecI/CopY family transcriptional regulator [Flavitalea sp. BT771]MDO6435665.1 BlaI/MecI/CopY family transcriptional regulator [Flavitalea sp. BT771]MDV6224566.1 BlaI/MecI/CopY family transcriptional regulator [Flavitalea sp. BT771]